MAAGIVAAIVTALALLRRDMLENLFVLLAGDSTAVALANVMLVVPPTAGAVALVRLSVSWQPGRRTMAVSAWQPPSLSSMTTSCSPPESLPAAS